VFQQALLGNTSGREDALDRLRDEVRTTMTMLFRDARVA
jgi:hypothetical protein